MSKAPDDDSGYAPYEANDEEFFGASGVVSAEYAKIHARRGSPDKTGRPDNMVGLALSGGGIRSASFALGVLQALAFAGWLKRVDYLSTVSGGGYIGASLTWLLHKAWPAPEGATGDVRFGVDEKNFPYALYPVAGGTRDAGAEKYAYRGRLLRYLRQNNRYLTPGHGIGALSLAAVLVRNSLYSLTIYGTLLLVAFMLLGPWLYMTPLAARWPWSLWPGQSMALNALGVLAVLFAFSALPYALWTASAQWRSWPSQYRGRRRYEHIAGRVLAVLIALGIASALPVVHDLLTRDATPAASAPQVFVVTPTASAPPIPTVVINNYPAAEKTPSTRTAGIDPKWFGSLSALFGVFSSVLAFFRAQSGRRNLIPTSVLVAIGTAAVSFGVLLISYDLYYQLSARYYGRPWCFAAVTIALLLGFIIFAALVNTNYMSVHRFYRDRLMETFTPNATDALKVDGVPEGVAFEADSKRLHETWPPADGITPGPYPIINTNVILVSSQIPKFRGRGGDNFIITPDYSGSNATGWTQTRKHYDWMTLATAMAISGSAVNPNTAVGGQGITRQPMLSFLMGLLNIRLGFWLLNPMPRNLRLERLKKQGHNVAWQHFWLWIAEMASPSVPNALWPGVSELFLRDNLEENSHMLQLSDGGHFENLGLYELIRRKLPLIIASDAGADPDYTFGDLANAIEKVRADFGVIITIDAGDLEQLSPRDGKEPGGNRFSQRGYLIARIDYPDAKGGSTDGTLIYLTTTFFESLSADLYGYRKVNPAFPDESTANQFFDERQFDAYRELGYQTAWQALRDRDVQFDPHVRAAMGRPPWPLGSGA